MSEETAAKSRRPKGLLPIFPAQECLKVVYAIRDGNAGKPYSKILLAQALNKSPTSSGYETLLASAVKYGMISYDRTSGSVALSQLGVRLAYPKPDEERAAITEAVLRIALIKSVVFHFRNNKLPPAELLQNTLIRDFGVPQLYVKETMEFILAEARWAGFLHDSKGSIFVLFDESSKSGSSPALSLLDSDSQDGSALRTANTHAESEVDEDEALSALTVTSGGIAPVENGTAKLPLPPASARVFIAHSKNSVIVKQIKQLFDATNVDYELAVEGETTAVPVPKKVADAMRRCTAAVINVSVDPNETTAGGEPRVNQNVLIEIGAAFVMYGDRVVLLWDKRVPVPSNLQGLYRCQYEGDVLSLEEGIKLIAAVRSGAMQV